MPLLNAARSLTTLIKLSFATRYYAILIFSPSFSPIFFMKNEKLSLSSNSTSGNLPSFPLSLTLSLSLSFTSKTDGTLSLDDQHLHRFATFYLNYNTHTFLYICILQLVLFFSLILDTYKKIAPQPIQVSLVKL